MRKLFVVLAVLAQGATVLALSAPAAGGLVADVGVSAVGKPGTVSPPGGVVLYQVTVTNSIAPEAQVTLNDSLAVSGGGSGAYFFADLTSGAVCTYSSPSAPTSASCDLGTMQSGESRVVEFVVQTPLVASTVVNTATATPLLFVEDDTSNNTATTSTAVVNDPNFSAALVRGGQALSFSATTAVNSVNGTLSVPTGQPGVITSLSVAPAGGATCGTSSCRNGLRVQFVDHPRFNDTVATTPLSLDLTFGMRDPCRGLGNTQCTALYVRKTPTSSTYLAPRCTTPGVASPAPCVDRLYKVSGDLHYVVLSLSSDPDYMPPLNF